jgi:hypothetical protein
LVPEQPKDRIETVRRHNSRRRRGTNQTPQPSFCEHLRLYTTIGKCLLTLPPDRDRAPSPVPTGPSRKNSASAKALVTEELTLQLDRGNRLKAATNHCDASLLGRPGHYPARSRMIHRMDFCPNTQFLVQLASLFEAVPYEKIVMAGIRSLPGRTPILRVSRYILWLSAFPRSCRCHSLLALARCPPHCPICGWPTPRGCVNRPSSAVSSFPPLPCSCISVPERTTPADVSRISTSPFVYARCPPQLFTTPAAFIPLRFLSIPAAAPRLSPSSPHIPGFLHNAAPSPRRPSLFFLSTSLSVRRSRPINTHC